MTFSPSLQGRSLTIYEQMYYLDQSEVRVVSHSQWDGRVFGSKDTCFLFLSFLPSFFFPSFHIFPFGCFLVGGGGNCELSWPFCKPRRYAVHWDLLRRRNDKYVRSWWQHLHFYFKVCRETALLWEFASCRHNFTPFKQVNFINVSFILSWKSFN